MLIQAVTRFQAKQLNVGSDGPVPTPGAPQSIDEFHVSAGAGAAAVARQVPRSVARGLAKANAIAPEQPKLSNLVRATRELQALDTLCQEKIAEARRSSGKNAAYHVLDDILFFKNRVVVPTQGGLRTELLKAHHDDPRAGHGGAGRTLELLSRNFHWVGIADDVRRYVSECSICQGNRIPRHKPYGSLESLPRPSCPWEEISIDFVTGLPSSQGLDGQTYDSSFVVDRYTKMANFFPTTKHLTAAQLARLIDQQVYSHYGVPRGIVSDRDPLFHK